MPSSILRIVLFLALTVLGIAVRTEEASTSPDSPPRTRKSTPIPNHFIVQYHKDVDNAARVRHEASVRLAASQSGQYRGVIRNPKIGPIAGYHGELDPAQVEELQQSNLVKSIIPDMRVYALTPKIPFPLPFTNDTEPHIPQDCPPDPNHGTTNRQSEVSDLTRSYTIDSPLWNLARISHRNASGRSYIIERPESTVYVLDTGIQIHHAQFASSGRPGEPPRASWGANFVDTNNIDDGGHGTHVAGIIGGLDYGVAPSANLVAVKVPNSTHGGTWSGVLAGINWACADARAHNRTSRSVINLSLGVNTVYDDIDSFVRATVVHERMTVVAAAGNDNANVDEMTPARVRELITVGSIGLEDRRSDFSNWGTGVDLFAPGENIESSFIGDEHNKTAIMGGTSMSAPHVSGLAAYLMQVHGPRSPEQMKALILSLATPGKMGTDSTEAQT